MNKVFMVMGLLAFASAAYGNGKMYWREEVPPEVPYQRALIMFNDGTQTLLLQSRYEVEHADEDTVIGWVVPVPAEPEVASMDASNAERFFLNLDRMTRPRMTRLRSAFFYGLLLTSFSVLLISFLSGIISVPAWFMRRRAVFFKASAASCFILLLIGSLLSPALGRGGAVEVVSEHSVGVYDVQVVRSDEAIELIEWLNENDFRFGAEDEYAFEDYIKRGWCFAVAQIKPEERRRGAAYTMEGLAAPLILRFPRENPVYPIMLTGTGGHDTKVLLYMTSDAMMSSDGRLKLRYAGKRKWLDDTLERCLLEDMVKPEGFFSAEEIDYSHILKFRHTLSSEQMDSDIEFHPDPDMKEYREHIIEW